MPNTRARESGFTLVELFVVIAIVSILSSFAIPKFASVIQRTKITELKMRLRHDISLENAYYYAYDEYTVFAFWEGSTQLDYTQPEGHFIYSFEKDTMMVSGKENGVELDQNSMLTAMMA